MNTVEFRQATQADAPATETILVWDLPVRVFHWGFATAFLVAFLSSESERWQHVHLAAGYSAAALIVFRLLWGLIGSRYARFGNFVRAPAAVVRYLSGLLRLRPPHSTGHNPAGALAVLALLGLGLITTLSGWMTFRDIGGKWLEKLHEGAAEVMLGLVCVHLAAVLLSSLLHRENLIGAMLHGYKQGAPDAGIRHAHAAVAFGVLLLAGVAIGLSMI